MAKRGVQGALSHSDLRSIIWRKLDEEYLEDGCPPGMWPWVVDVHDGFFIAKVFIDGEYGLYKIPYTAGADGALDLGSPILIAAKDQAQVQGSLSLVASLVATDNDEAVKLLADLESTNTLFASLKDTPNAHFAVFDLTTIGKASQHAGKWKYRLAKGGLKAAMPTLIGKPVHVTSGLDGHFDEGEPAKPIGVFMGSTEIDNEDGTSTLRAIANLWESDFPDLVEVLAKRKAELGASYEIVYAASNAVAKDGVVEISDYQFSGGAILKRTAAAHPETKVHVAKAEAKTDPPTPQPRQARIPIPTIPAHAGRSPMTKYTGIPAELESVVDALLAQFALEHVEPLKAESLVLKADKEKLDSKIIDLTTSKNDLQAQLTQKIDECTVAAAAYAEAQGKLDDQVFKAACAEHMQFIAAKYGLTQKQTEETRRLEIVAKLVAKKESVSIAEFDTLISGGTGRRLVVPPAAVPLMAGRSDDGPSPAEIAKTFPGAVKNAYR